MAGIRRAQYNGYRPIRVGNKVFKYNESKGKYYCQEEVDPEYFFKKHNLVLIDNPALCVETLELEEYFNEKIKEKLERSIERGLRYAGSKY